MHRIPLPLPNDGLRAVNVYVLETEQGLTLVDGGWAIADARSLLESSLRNIGYGFGDIRHFLVTHVHRDHYTLASVLAQELGAGISLGIGDKATLDLLHGTHDGGAGSTYDLLRAAGALDEAEQWRAFDDGRTDLSTWGYPDTWLEDDHRIEVGERTLDAVHTPGHTQATSSSPTPPRGCSSPATTCCRPSRRRSAPSRCRWRSRCATSWAG